jgi:hypothetical protein
MKLRHTTQSVPPYLPGLLLTLLALHENPVQVLPRLSVLFRHVQSHLLYVLGICGGTCLPTNARNVSFQLR